MCCAYEKMAGKCEGFFGGCYLDVKKAKAPSNYHMDNTGTHKKERSLQIIKIVFLVALVIAAEIATVIVCGGI